MPRHILDLADELLSGILSFLAQNGRAPLNGLRQNGHSRNDLSQNSHGSDSDLNRWRLVCKRFMPIGTPRRFERFSLRCSEEGFHRLDELLNMQLACYVKSLTYLVRPHYQGGECKAVLQTLSKKNPSLSQLHSHRLHEQNIIIETNHDLQQLHLAITNFPSLQEIKLLRLQDEADQQLLSFVGYRALQNTRHLQLSWEAACTRAVTNLSTALLDSHHTSIRFIGPQLSPEASLHLLQTPAKTISALATRLTSLDITFTSDRDVTIMMACSSDTFGHLFNAATNLTSLHIGFPSLLPLDLELDTIFHGTSLRNLHTLSLQGWRLSSHEITTLANRHRHTLRELRLCAIYLRPGGRWRDVLSSLREEMDHLERFHLRDIDYEGHFEATAVLDGVEVFDIPFAEMVQVQPSQMGTTPPGVQVPDPRAWMAESGCGECDERRDRFAKVVNMSVNDLGDDGIQVRPGQIPLWEAWVLAGRRGVPNGYLC